MSTRIPSSHFDGIQDLWHHYGTLTFIDLNKTQIF